MGKVDYKKLWGKTLNNNELYPLFCHMLDSAAVSSQWLLNDRCLLDIFKDNSCLSGTDEDIISLLSFVTALHDFGKATICFQNKVPELAKKAGVHDEIRERQSFNHGLYGAYWLSQYDKAVKLDKRKNTNENLVKFYDSLGSFNKIFKQLRVGIF